MPAPAIIREPSSGKRPDPDFAVLFRSGDYDALVRKALPLAAGDSVAARYLVWTVCEYANPFVFGSDTVGLIEAAAVGGDPYALLAKGCFELYTQPHSDSCSVAAECFSRALGLGVQEAGVALAQMCRRGELGTVDALRAESLMSDAREHGCGFAFRTELRDMVFGRPWLEADPGEALRQAGELAEGDPENPWWPYIQGCAQRECGSLSSSAGYFGKAAGLGLRVAWGDLAVALSHDDSFRLTDRDLFLETLSRGAGLEDHSCLFLLAMYGIEGFENLPASERAEASRQFVSALEKACSRGSLAAAEVLGDVFLEGRYGVGRDIHAAWTWYCRGAALANDSCYSSMFDMVRGGLVEKDLGFRDMCALQGARLGNRKMLSETVVAYSQGRLSEYADEIESLYAPVFDSPDGDGADDIPDDDGRYDAYA